MSQKYFVKVTDSGATLWYKDPEMKIRHRVGGPAVECHDGGREWYQDGLLHRLDGPAIELPSGYRRWVQNGQCHRLDGPAIELASGQKFYCIAGNMVSVKRFPKLAREFNQPRVREMTMAELEKALGHAIKIIK